MKKFLVTICAVGALFSGCGSSEPAEQSKPSPSIEQANQDKKYLSRLIS